MLPQSSRIHILLRFTWNILQIDHMLGHKTSLGKFKKTEIISRVFSDHNTMLLESTTRKKKKTP